MQDSVAGFTRPEVRSSLRVDNTLLRKYSQHVSISTMECGIKFSSRLLPSITERSEVISDTYERMI